MGGVMRYATLIYQTGAKSLNPGAAGTAAYHVFSANGCYDPDISGTGHQPRGFDQFMLMYDHYVVVGSKITLVALNTDSTYSQILGVIRRDNSSTLGTDGTETATECGNCVWELLSPAGQGEGSKTKLELTINPAKFLGRGNPLSDPELKGNSSSNPSEEAYFTVWAQPLQAVDSTVIRFNAIIEYSVAFIEAKNPGAS